jgi:hypothetical protein
MLKVACSAIVKILGGPYMGVAAVGYPILRKMGLITNQNVFQKPTLFHNPMTEIHLSFAILWFVSQGMGTSSHEPPDTEQTTFHPQQLNKNYSKLPIIPANDGKKTHE